MSSKINIWSIVSGHINTLRDASDKKVSINDYITFYGLPILFSLLFITLNIKVTGDANTLLVNFGAIFTALLLSVLVLVYDQGEKLNQPNTDASRTHTINLKKDLLQQLYFNICYAIVISITLVFFCLMHEFITEELLFITLRKFKVSIDLKTQITSPTIIFLAINLILTILMVVKRMHTLLTLKI